jgi:hypothetical protein
VRPCFLPVSCYGRIPTGCGGLFYRATHPYFAGIAKLNQYRLLQVVYSSCLITGCVEMIDVEKEIKFNFADNYFVLQNIIGRFTI